MTQRMDRRIIELFDAFHNDTRPARQDKKAADLARARTVAFFGKHFG